MQRRWWIGLLLLVGSFIALAGEGRQAVRKQIESSMLVAGMVDIGEDGSVSGYMIDRARDLPEGVVKIIDRNVSKWRFVPIRIDGKPVKAKTRMNLLLVAKKLDESNFAVSIRSASFGSEDTGSGAGQAATSDTISAVKMAPPRYPDAAVQTGVQGTVYLALRIGRQGNVEDAIVEQVNLRVIGTETQMTRSRELLARATLEKARSWTFNAPKTGKEARLDFWSVRVPVDYTFDREPSSHYGQWVAYVPGPRADIPWILEPIDASYSPDSLAAGTVYQIGSGPQLLTPLDKG